MSNIRGDDDMTDLDRTNKKKRKGKKKEEVRMIVCLGFKIDTNISLTKY